MISNEASTLRIKPSDELTIYQVEELTKQLCMAFGNAGEVVIDLTQTDKIDTAGFQLLVSLKKSCEATQKRFEIVGAGESVQNFMTVFGSQLCTNKEVADEL